MEVFKSMFPPTPTLTEKNLSDQSGKVFLVTGSSSGVGEQLAQILYQHNAKVYVATRSEAKAGKAIERIKSLFPNSKGQLLFLHLDLNDLTTIKKSANEFLGKEDRLDVLWNNAGVMVPPPDQKTAQGYDLQLGTNNLAPFLFTRLLHPVLAKTAKTAPADSVRVVWVSSSAADMGPKPAMDAGIPDKEGPWSRYGRSKAGNVIHSAEYARRVKDDGIISLSLNPGNLKTDLQRHIPKWQLMIINRILYPSNFGAYTELFAGLSPKVTAKESGGWVAPWGRLVPGRKELMEPEIGVKFWNWTEKQIEEYF
ncbi:hypothetical protein MMC06_001479 [Schaereria dolodes]|nr:hypothetical protein [Schaereria dolodes]